MMWFGKYTRETVLSGILTLRKTYLPVFPGCGDREPPTHIQVALAEYNQITIVTFTVTGVGSEQECPFIVDFLERI